MNEKVRFNIDNSLFDDIRKYIDGSDILGLSNSNISRIRLVLFAGAVGMRLSMIGKSEPMELSSAKAFVRGENIVTGFESQILSVAFNEFKKTNQDEAITDDGASVSIFEKYANTGLREILSWIHGMQDYSDDSREAVLFEQISELDDMYESLFSSPD